MAWLIRQESGGYVLADQHPIVQNGALYFSESDTVGVTPQQAAILLHGSTLKPGEWVALKPSTAHCLKPGYYAANADGTLHWFERRPQRYEGQWYHTDCRSEIVTRECLEGNLERVPEPTDTEPTRYGSQQAHHASVVGTDVLTAPASKELLDRGIKPRKQLGFLLRRRRYSGTLLTAHPARVFDGLKDYRYQPAFTLEDAMWELLKYGRIRFERMSDERVMVTIDQSNNLFIDRNIIQSVFGALLYANAMLEKELP